MKFVDDDDDNATSWCPDGRRRSRTDTRPHRSVDSCSSVTYGCLSVGDDHAAVELLREFRRRNVVYEQMHQRDARSLV